MTYPRIAVSVPQFKTGVADDESFYGFWRIAQQGWEIVPTPAGRCDVAHNKAVISVLIHNEQAREAGHPERTFTHLVTLDADHVHPKNTIQHLGGWVKRDPDKYQVVTGLNFRRSKPFEPCAYITDEDGYTSAIGAWDQGIAEVDHAGTGSMIIDMRVFEKAGVQVWTDTWITAPHMAKVWITDKQWRLFVNSPEGKWKYRAYEMRRKILKQCVPELFEGGQYILYVGANQTRAHYAREMKAAGNEVDLLEIDERNVKHWREREDSPFIEAHVGDIRQSQTHQIPPGIHDACFWWHGPEHVERDELDAALANCEASVKPGGLVVLGCPWGEGPDGGPASRYEKHRSAWDVEDFTRLGYHVQVNGDKDSDHSSLIAWKRKPKE